MLLNQTEVGNGESGKSLTINDSVNIPVKTGDVLGIYYYFKTLYNELCLLNPVLQTE